MKNLEKRLKRLEPEAKTEHELVCIIQRETRWSDKKPITIHLDTNYDEFLYKKYHNGYASGKAADVESARAVLAGMAEGCKKTINVIFDDESFFEDDDEVRGQIFDACYNWHKTGIGPEPRKYRIHSEWLTDGRWTLKKPKETVGN
jgi:hypothetical protein